MQCGGRAVHGTDDVLQRARAAYRDAVADPTTFALHADSLIADARRCRSTEAVVLALRAKAWSQRGQRAGESPKALLANAAKLARRAGLDARLGEVLVTRAAVNHELGRLSAAQRDLDAAAALIAESGTAELRLQQAALHHNVGRLSTAAVLYRRLVADPQTPVDIRTKAANNLALIEVQLGAVAAAETHIELAVSLAPSVGPAVCAGVAASRAWLAVHSGRLADGLRLFDEAERLHIKAGLPLGEHYLEYVDALEELRLIPEARVAARRAVEEFERNDVALMAAEGQLRVARLAVLAGDGHTAEAAARAALRRLQRQRRSLWAARAATVLVMAETLRGPPTTSALVRAKGAAVTLDRLGVASFAVDAYLTAGRVALDLGRTRTAIATFDRARQLSARSSVLVRLKGHVAGALESRLTGAVTATLRQCRAGLADLDRHRAALSSMELRIRAAEHGVELGRLGLEIALRRGSAGDVLLWMERTRAAALLAAEPADTHGIDDELDALRTVEAELAEARGTLQREPPELLARQAVLENQIRRRTWVRTGHAAATERLRTPSELRGVLDGRTLVEYGVLDGRLFAVVLEPKRSRVVELGELSPVRFHVDTVLFGLRRLLRQPRSERSLIAARAAAATALDALRELLVRPLKLSPGTPLVVGTIGALQRVPWSALHTAPLALAPSASMWARSLRPHVTSPEHVALIAGPALPGAIEEVESIRSVHPAATVLAPPNSTVEAVTTALAGADLAHLACHGRLRSDNPSFSALRLCGGALTVHELYVRGIAPPRMILAACDSGADVAYDGNEVLGFVSSLMARGTAGLVASIVLISDAAAVPLMRTLHHRIRTGDRLAAALHQARAELDPHDPAQFVNWCAFNAYGAA
jgi:tetratricopeptide (TPR) repeat protein